MDLHIPEIELCPFGDTKVPLKYVLMSLHNAHAFTSANMLSWNGNALLE